MMAKAHGEAPGFVERKPLGDRGIADRHGNSLAPGRWRR
jgi:hypothetical protein